MSRNFARFLALAAPFVLAACEGPGTPSGRPEVALDRVDRACFSARFLDGAMSNGWRLKSSSDLQLVLGKEAGNAAAVLFGSAYGLPEQRLTVTMIPQPPSVLRVVIDGAYVTNPGTAVEQPTAMTFSARDQAAFEAMGERARAQCPARP